MRTDVIPMVGKQFGRLSVLNFHQSRNGRALWFCRCKCGTPRIVSGKDLRSGHTLSCGCYHRDKAREGAAYNLANHHAEYRTWQGMLNRCRNPNQENFKYYGGRGITVCERWSSFENFLEDMGTKPSGATLDRRDNSVGYSKENCRWTTRRQQMRNTRTNKVIKCDGKSLTLSEWAEETGIKANTILCRLDKYGWSAERALTEPIRTR